MPFLFVYLANLNFDCLFSFAKDQLDIGIFNQNKIFSRELKIPSVTLSDHVFYFKKRLFFFFVCNYFFSSIYLILNHLKFWKKKSAVEIKKSLIFFVRSLCFSFSMKDFHGVRLKSKKLKTNLNTGKKIKFKNSGFIYIVIIIIQFINHRSAVYETWLFFMIHSLMTQNTFVKQQQKKKKQK